ncbi:MAG: glycosyltransferase [Sphingomonadaceae bacterium]
MTATAIIVIGRNEGDRLKACLRSLPHAARIIYVDSGSSDGSQDFARAQGVEVIDLALDIPFTAARARNAGLARLAGSPIEFVQMVDGDCELDPAWLENGAAALHREPCVAAVFGRRRERHPDHSIYNQLCDDEWNVPVGEVRACGGDALFRMAPLAEVGGYTDSLIAGEEPDLCLRLRARGWRIRRIDHEMTTHDAAITRFDQWWRRTKRSGHAFAEHVARHRSASDPDWFRQLGAILFWGLCLPIAAIAALMVAIIVRSPGFWVTIAAVLIALYPLQWLRVAWRKQQSGASRSFATSYSTLMMAAKFAQMTGAIGFVWGYIVGKAPRIIEYKSGGRRA